MDYPDKDSTDLKKGLESLSYLKGMDINSLYLFFTLKRLTTGEILFREGDKATFMAFIISGKLEIKKQTEFPGKYFVLSILGRGSFFGERAISADEVELRSATVTALEKTSIALLQRGSFDDIYNNNPDVAAKLLRALLHEVSFRLNGANERMASVF